MKKMILVTVILLSQQLLAHECVDKEGFEIINKPDVFLDLIAKSEACHEAVQLAEACAWGSSMDVSTVSEAYGVCQNELYAQNPQTKLVEQLNNMNEMCRERYEKEQGTLYMSLRAYCSLSAIEWIVNLATE